MSIDAPAVPGEWTAATPPNGDCSYGHCACDTPLGLAVVEWKSRNPYPSFGLLVGGESLDTFHTLDEAKEAAIERVKIVASKCSA